MGVKGGEEWSVRVNGGVWGGGWSCGGTDIEHKCLCQCPEVCASR